MSVGALASWLLWISAFILVLRLPGSVILSGLLPLSALLLTRLWHPRADSRLLWLFFALGLASSAIGVVLHPNRVGIINYFSLTAIFAIFSAAILAGGREQRASASVMHALYHAFMLTTLIGWAEVVSGFKLQSVLYPDASTLVLPGRFYVAAFLPNINDFAVIVTMFGLMALTRILWEGNARHTVQLGRLIGVLGAFVLVLQGGSRGALAAFLVGTAVILFTSVRVASPGTIRPWMIVTSAPLAVGAAALIWTSPAIQDNSTKARGDILAQTLAISFNDPATLWFGWGHQDAFMDAASRAFPGELLDPHNVLLELLTWYGLPTVVALVVFWCLVSWRGLWKLQLRPGWTNASAALLFLLIPVLGIVPSSMMRYYYLFLFASCAMAALQPLNRKAMPCNAG